MDTVINIPEYDCDNDDDSDDCDDCPICLTTFKSAEDIVHMQCCKKMLHISCYINCITQKKECPMCRKNIILNNTINNSNNNCISNNSISSISNNSNNISRSTIVEVHPTHMMGIYSLQQSNMWATCIMFRKYTLPFTIIFAAGVFITYYAKSAIG
jgi:hypothetical protein